MESAVPGLVTDRAAFASHFTLVQSYVRSEPGSHTALMAAAKEDPVGMTSSIVALGAVLLDVAAGALRLTPDAMLDKVADSISQLTGAPPPAGRTTP